MSPAKYAPGVKDKQATKQRRFAPGTFNPKPTSMNYDRMLVLALAIYGKEEEKAA